MKNPLHKVPWLAATVGFLLVAPSTPARASSHMDAPLITLDDAANTTDVYAFLSSAHGQKYLTTALAVYPHEEPGVGPNKYNFDDDVLYQIHVATGADVAAGRATYSYQFRFSTRFRNRKTILQSYLGVINNVGDAAQNLIQTYTVTRINHRTGAVECLGEGIVPPNNQGNATPRYNRNDDGEQPARDGVATEGELDRYTKQAIAELSDGYIAFAGQRDDGFYADVQAIFDLLKLRPSGSAVDSQGGFNVHTMTLNIPLERDRRRSADRRRVRHDQSASSHDSQLQGGSDSARRIRSGRPSGQPAVQRGAGRSRGQGLVQPHESDSGQRAVPQVRGETRARRTINALVFNANVAPTTNRTDIAGIFIPDLIKVDVSTAPARLAGGGASDPDNPDDAGFSRLGIFGGDVLTSRVQAGFGGGTVPGGWPNGRRFGDDVVDIAVTALISDLRVSPPIIRGPAGDNVDKNDIAYNKVFPYASTPHNGRNHTH